MGRGTSSVAHGPESHDGAPAAGVSTADNRSRGVGHFAAGQPTAARRGSSVFGVCKKAPTTSAAHGERPPVSAHEERGVQEETTCGGLEAARDGTTGRVAVRREG